MLFLAVGGWLFIVSFWFVVYSGNSTRRTFTELSGAKNPEILTFREERKKPKVSEVRRVVYVRIPKTGSSTITLLVWRFAWIRNLTVLAVKPQFEGTRERLNREMFFLPPHGQKYDVMAEHVLYDKLSYAEYFAEDAIYFTLLREPFSMLYSTLYYVPQFKKTITAENKVETYLKNPAKYDNIGIMANRSYTKNPQASYLGLKRWDFDSMMKIDEFISSVDRDFPLVMILERLDESLVFLRRILKWPMKDIIYSINNVNRHKPQLRFNPRQKYIYRNWSFADHKLYDYFLAKLEKAIQNGGAEFQDELDVYRKCKGDVTTYCRFRTITDETLWIPQSRYNEAFSVTRKDCSLIFVEPLVLISSIRKRQNSFPYLSPSL
ncbi:galactose-3-O-sulfotransferase 2-like [Liolophura sinensis]|uniref:galactose-3-O-sulfotransferase 2-like n=1 Tax=Liolophura sinensis TaxID=3198878 RepID=UPI0031586A50